MAKIGEIYEFLNSLAPFETQDSFDNSGLLVGDKNQEATRVLLAMDATPEAINEAKRLGCNLLVTHHPVIFNGIKALTPELPAYMLLNNGISCISAHTNLDCAEYGISDIMCDLLGFENIHQLVDANRKDKEGNEVGYGAVGICCEMTPESLAMLCKQVFKTNGLRYVAGNRTIKKVAMISGAGGDFWWHASKLGADAYITADVKHHQFLDAHSAGLTLIDAGHHETEVVAMPYLQKVLSERFGDTEFLVSQLEYCVKSI